MAEGQQQEVPMRHGREGARWINTPPTSEEFGSWAKENITIDPALAIENYVGGIVLIPATSKVKRVIGFNRTNGMPVMAEGEELSHIPYAKVETRINYFWDLLAAHDDWVGVVENVTPPRLPIDAVRQVTEERAESGEPKKIIEYGASAMRELVWQLPEGFHVMSVPVDSGYTHMLCCTKRVAIYKRGEEAEKNARPLREGVGTKMVPLVAGRREHFADPNSIMKAETGALGRALGFAGIFVIPGSGVATAEDVQESMAQGQPPSHAPQGDGEGPAAPPVPAVSTGAQTGAEQAQQSEEELRAAFGKVWRQLRDDHPGDAQALGEQMVREGFQNVRSIPLDRLVALTKEAEGILDKAEQRTQQQPEESTDEQRDTPDGAAPAEPAGAPDAPDGPAEAGDGGQADATAAPDGGADGEPSGS